MGDRGYSRRDDRGGYGSIHDGYAERGVSYGNRRGGNEYVGGSGGGGYGQDNRGYSRMGDRGGYNDQAGQGVGGGYGRNPDRRRRGGGEGGGAEHLARIHGTEEDRVNCPFYFKIGTCRHGDRCSRLHNKPLFSQTVLIPHMYQNPASALVAGGLDPSSLDEKQVEEDFEDFYEEIFEELGRFGRLKDVLVCDNLGDHMVGNVYAKYDDEEDADKALKALFGRFYAGRPLVCEFSPVTDFREARCRQFDENTCTRGGYCNFMHIKRVPRSIERRLKRENGREHRSSNSRSRSRSRDHRSRSRSRDRGGRRERRSSKGDKSGVSHQDDDRSGRSKKDTVVKYDRSPSVGKNCEMQADTQ